MLESYGVGTAVLPIGDGWRYEQPMPDGSSQRIPPSGCAGTDSNLVQMVQDFRIANAIDLGEPALDVADYIKRVSPINNRFPGRREAPRPARGHRPLIERLKSFLVALAPRQPRLLIEDEADERASICASCPQNVKWQIPCSGCNVAIADRGRNVRQRPSYKNDSKLGGCRLHDLFLPTAVFIDREYLPEVNPEAPANCWLRRNT